ncbi:magnesium transporter [Alcaligenes endophyticus]|uniref:Magnesium transporter MgtE n=1 Tax=Alcaligenes endophyticus TaxID=1929088 RepID=A0ABT8EIH4_9BURK|nr:magnesium transporter [Alcaligenes endophyticus]MCX5592563.1 magnesium transporter [Alcaligenes endophyticus]MDN4121089.1 magnesium transporter [Alcaligenes endophyticus]
MLNHHGKPAFLNQLTLPADLVVALNQLDSKQAISAARLMDDESLVATLEFPELHHAVNILLDLAHHQRWAPLETLAEDRLADLLQSLNHKEQERILSHLSQPTRSSVLRLMHYPADTAGGIMTTEFLQVPIGWTVERTLQHIREVESTRETVYAIYVVNEQKQLQFVVPLRKLVCADPNAELIALWKGESPVVVRALTDKEAVAQIIRRHDYLAVPVVDEEHTIIGIVTVDDVIDTLMEEAAEDISRFGGAEHIGKPYLHVNFWLMIRKRGGWLAALFLGEMLTASAMQYYEFQLEKAVVLAMFIPLIMSSGGNSGSQATSLLIRGLALGEVHLKDWWRVLLRELPTGLILGTLLGAVGFLRIEVWQHAGLFDYGEYSLLIAFTIWVALVGIVTFGSCVGSMLPFLLQRVGFDPASASAPLVATLVDVIGLVIYFSVAALFLTGTLL